MAKRTIKVADYDTQKGIKLSVEGNAAKLDDITKLLEIGGGVYWMTLAVGWGQ